MNPKKALDQVEQWAAEDMRLRAEWLAMRSAIARWCATWEWGAESWKREETNAALFRLDATIGRAKE